MAHRQRYEHLQKKRAKELQKRAKVKQRVKDKNSTNELKKDDSPKETKEKSGARAVLGWVMYLAIVLCATYLIVTFVGQRTKVSGDSMLPTLHDGDNLIVDKITYVFRDPERYEVIVFPYRRMEDTFYIKRIIGLPGETVQIIDGYVYINGKKLNENYGREVMIDAGIAAQPITLGKDEYFVLGDNRNHSSDSRNSGVGLIHEDEIIGRALLRIWPLNRFGVISHD